MPSENYQFKDLTHQIIGAAMRVHSFLGNGFQEVIYQRALAYEFNQANLNFQREQEQYIFYRECPEPIGTRRADFIVEGKVLVELKATTKIEEVHWAQILNYLRAYRYEVGLLINFGEKSLFFKRFVMNLDDKADTTKP
ncbi:GxxExxY protein [Roseivirga ehrenbergii]|uniref:GxxExxY protein n=2 Tax=Roseivirga ehrenbergii (strain DSM 102268 / JCM 13514 / KCTC 12282 / NCIMB 14502 / KMM 6017) TaxID=279360 RepID=A0A150X6T6_ROSEK|nr:GxxExxY protein [Roseivirga ehrenbergii]KYG74428.1 GxxExxY protein [Roseivirga ehrenbergii]TCL14269.1 GxxExxY protein [Roseivirga ehrenbergii]